MIFRRDRFGDLVRRQLDLFAEEAYGDFQLVLESVRDNLAELRDTYAATLDGEATDAYEQAFDRAARKRFGSLVGGL